MAYEKKDGDFAIFRQTNKKNDKAPDWKGNALIDGKEYEVACWLKRDGGMLAGNIKPAGSFKPQAQGSNHQRSYEAQKPIVPKGNYGALDDSDIPF